MPAIIKQDLRVENLDQFIYSLENKPTYVYISRTSEWDNETNPPTPNDSTQDEYSALSQLVGLKRINPVDVCSVVPRTNWISGNTYDQYDHEVDLINTRNPETGDFWRYYVVTEDFNVYKCLSNSYRSASTNRPTGTDPNAFQTPDGYIWKYMYTIQASDAFKFMTSNWMPCYTLQYNDGSAQWNSQQSATPGTIDNIDVTVAGTGYDPQNPPTVSIDGDGSGAEAVAEVNSLSGEIDDIVITNSGEYYTNATITITDGTGSGLGAEAVATIGTRKGHGFDPKTELGAHYLMMRVELDGNEGGLFNTGINYRVSGVIQQPKHVSNTVVSIKIDTQTSYLYQNGQTVTGETSGATGDIIHVDKQSGILYLNNIQGQFVQSENISSNVINSTSILSVFADFEPLINTVYAPDTFNKNTGNLFYIANREPISRVDNQKEEVMAVITF